MTIAIVIGMIALIAGLLSWAGNVRHPWNRPDIRDALQSSLGDLSTYSAYQKQLPIFRLPDVYRALDIICERDYVRVEIASEHAEPMSLILSDHFYSSGNRVIRSPKNIDRPIAVDKDAFFPADGFNILTPTDESGVGPFVVRVKVDDFRKNIILEVGSSQNHDPEALIGRVLNLASEHSVYRTQTLDVSFEKEVRNEYGDVEEHAVLDIRFVPQLSIESRDIILDDETTAVLDRNIFDFHQRRQQLRALGLPGRRGLLFYGPPGTGKTYTCKHIAYRLKDVTTIAVSGRSLLHMRSICQIARMLQPSLIVLEDVDLVYSSRDLTGAGVFLGELMDELDGFASEDQIMFILTTNALDRVESAIKDRPGRISQCIYFGYPGPDLRRRYLDALTRRYLVSDADLDLVVGQTDRVSQAFLKEMVFRAAQIASLGEPMSHEATTLAIRAHHFDEAIREMKRGAGREGAAILGFLAA